VTTACRIGVSAKLRQFASSVVKGAPPRRRLTHTRCTGQVGRPAVTRKHGELARTWPKTMTDVRRSYPARSCLPGPKVRQHATTRSGCRRPVCRLLSLITRRTLPPAVRPPCLRAAILLPVSRPPDAEVTGRSGMQD